MNTIEPPLPPTVAKQLSDLELRHKRHQAMLDEHHERMHRRREDHRRGIHRTKFPAYCLK